MNESGQVCLSSPGTVTAAFASTDAHAATTEQSGYLSGGRIPSLDGLRAISIALVIIGHGSATVPGVSRKLHEFLIDVAGMGVTVFFVLSGFLITTLLLKEFRSNGKIGIRAFYIRRAFRIWPAFYVLICFVALLGVFRFIPLSLGEVASSSLFFWNYYPAGSTWFLGHTWSLSVEEQFYLLWPLSLGLSGPRRATVIAIVIIALEPLVRVGNYLLVPSTRGHIGMMLHTRADALMTGALVALLYGNKRFENVLKHLFVLRLPLLSALILLFLNPLLQQRWRGAYNLSVGFSLQNVLIGLIMLWAIRNSGSPCGRFLNSRFIVHVGCISFSLYLWQQIFLTADNHTITGIFPLNLAIAFAVAECSYWFVEKPFLRLRRRFVGPDASA